MFITIDNRSAAEKKTHSNILVQAIDFKRALDNLEKGMKGTMADYSVDKIEETKIIDIFKFNQLND